MVLSTLDWCRKLIAQHQGRVERRETYIVKYISKKKELTGV